MRVTAQTPGGALSVRRSSFEPDASATGPHILTVALEDYYHVGAFNRVIQRGQWYRFERRIEASTMRTLDLLDEFQSRATFFVLGWVADTMPELIRVVAERGHEIASKGYYHRNIRQLTPAEFRDDLARAREALERAGGHRIIGYRVADDWFQPADLWALDVLADEGYEYDSSVGPILRSYASEPWRRFAHLHRYNDRTLWELPISTADIFGFLVPIAGGNYFRQFPERMVRRAVAQWTRTYTAPYVMYFHTWELDPDQPKINSAPWFSRVRQYRNLDRMPQILRYYLKRYQFTTAAGYLGLTPAAIRAESRETILPRARVSGGVMVLKPASSGDTQIGGGDARGLLSAGSGAGPVLTAPPAERIPVSVVIPCYNEELILPYLANTLASVEAHLTSYAFTFIFIDDHSSDGTNEALHRIFGDRPNCIIVRHATNQGVAAGIVTGIQRATTEIVCSMDCDCTYDPHELAAHDPAAGRRRRPGDGIAVPRARQGPQCAVLAPRPLQVAVAASIGSCSTSGWPRIQAVFGFTAGARPPQSSWTTPASSASRRCSGSSTCVDPRSSEYPTTLEVRMIGRSKMKVAADDRRPPRTADAAGLRIAWRRAARRDVC